VRVPSTAQPSAARLTAANDRHGGRTRRRQPAPGMGRPGMGRPSSSSRTLQALAQDGLWCGLWVHGYQVGRLGRGGIQFEVWANAEHLLIRSWPLTLVLYAATASA